MKLWRFVLKNLFRNKRRTLLTIASLGFSIFIVNTLLSVLHGLENPDSGSEVNMRLMVRHKVSLTNPLPESYWEKIKSIPHVVVVCPRNWFGGTYKDQTFENFFARFSTDPATELAIASDIYSLPPDQAKAWKEDRRGAIAGKYLFDKYGWKIGDNITVKGDIYPVDIELTLRGMLTAKTTVEDEKVLLFQRDYLEELTGKQGIVGIYWVKVDSPESIGPVSKTIDASFENSDAETLTETEKQFQADFISMLGNIKGLIKMISLVVAIAILMVAANTMAMAVRERTSEIAVLGAIGFQPGRVLAIIVAESVLIALAAGLAACAASFFLFNFLGFKVPVLVWTPMVLTPWSAGVALGIAVTIGLISGLIPGFLSARLSVVDGLRKVA